eukprot:jgi/Botrbrau1/10842/Bobra.0025s0021.1
MRTMLRPHLFLAALALGFAALASGEPPKKQDPSVAAELGQLFTVLDLNNDGFVDWNEYKLLFTALDKTGDGKVEAKELGANPSKGQPSFYTMNDFRKAFNDLDKKKDGKLTRAEFNLPILGQAAAPAPTPAPAVQKTAPKATPKAAPKAAPPKAAPPKVATNAGRRLHTMEISTHKRSLRHQAGNSARDQALAFA